MGDRRSEIAAELRKGAEETVELFRNLQEKQLQIRVYDEAPGWSVRQVLAHLVTIEKSMHWLFNNILQGGMGTPEDFDVERFNRTQPQKLDGLGMDELIERFRSVREETLAIVAGMKETDLDRTGRHAFHGPGRLERFVRWAHEHARIHEEDVRRAIAGQRHAP